MNTDLIKEILLGGLLGFLGQGIRVVLGVIKLQASNKAKSLTNDTPEEFNVGQIFLSLFIGFLAGALALVFKVLPVPTANDTSTMLPIVAAGYAGADFIEGILSKVNPTPQKPIAPNNNNQVADGHPLIVSDEAQQK